MTRLLKNICIHALLIFFISSASFFLIHLIPGDPVDFILKEGASFEDKQILREQLFLNKPLVEQYSIFIRNLLDLNLGKSLHTDEYVFDTILHHLNFTARLAFFSLFLAFFLALVLGVYSVRWQSNLAWSFLDNIPVFLFSVPVFVSAPLLIWIFCLYFPLLPVSGSGSFSHLILPSVSLALPLGAILFKMIRNSLLEVFQEDYIRTARAKGLSENVIYFKHIFFNAIIPVISILGLQLGALLTGTVIVEVIFDRPGLGQLLYSSIVTRDYPLVQGSVLCTAVIYIFINRMTDKVYGWFQPLLKEGG